MTIKKNMKYRIRVDVEGEKQYLAATTNADNSVNDVVTSTRKADSQIFLPIKVRTDTFMLASYETGYVLVVDNGSMNAGAKIGQVKAGSANVPAAEFEIDANNALESGSTITNVQSKKMVCSPGSGIGTVEQPAQLLTRSGVSKKSRRYQHQS